MSQRPRQRVVPNPWWKSPWAVVPAALAGGTAVGVGIVQLVSGRARCVSATSTGGVIEGVRYLERIRGDAESEDELPMVLVLHSLGGRPEGYAGGMGGIGRARLILPEGEYVSGTGKSWFGKGLHQVVDGGNTDADVNVWRDAGDRLARFIDAITRCRPTVGKPIATGSSQGAEAALVLANDHRHKIHGAVAVNGDMPEPLWRSRMAPTVMINGIGDKTVPFAWAQEHAMTAINDGAPLSFTPFPSTGHDVTAAMGKAWIASVRAMVSEVGAKYA
jgi:phospholipase/carboxylesterase